MCPFWGPTVPEDLACLLFFVFTSQQNMRRSENRNPWSGIFQRCSPVDRPMQNFVKEQEAQRLKSLGPGRKYFTFRKKIGILSFYRLPLGIKVKNFPAKHAHTRHRRTDVSSARSTRFLHFTVSRLWIFLLLNRKAFYKPSLNSKSKGSLSPPVQNLWDFCYFCLVQVHA